MFEIFIIHKRSFSKRSSEALQLDKTRHNRSRTYHFTKLTSSICRNFNTILNAECNLNAEILNTISNLPIAVETFDSGTHY